MLEVGRSVEKMYLILEIMVDFERKRSVLRVEEREKGRKDCEIVKL